MSNNTQSDRKYNVIIQGFGYVNRIREIKPKNGTPYLACDVALMMGTGDNVTLARFNCAIRGSNAKEIVRAHFTNPQGEVVHPENTTVVASMTLGGISARNFVYSKGEKKGQTGIALQSALLSFKWLKIGDSVVDIDATPEVQDANGSAQPANSQPGFVHEMVAEYRQYGSVRLSKEHPEFEARRKWLKDNGFTWNKDKQAWVRKDNGNAVAQSQAPQEPPAEVVSQGVTENYSGGFEDWEDDIPF